MKLTIGQLRRIIQEAINWAQLDDEEEDRLDGIEGRPSDARQMLREKYQEFLKSPAGRRGPEFFWKAASKDPDFQKLFSEAEVSSAAEVEKVVADVGAWQEKNKYAGLLKLARKWVRALEDGAAEKRFVGVNAVRGKYASKSSNNFKDFTSTGYSAGEMETGNYDVVAAFIDPSTGEAYDYNIIKFVNWCSLKENEEEAIRVARNLGAKSFTDMRDMLYKLPEAKPYITRANAAVEELANWAKDQSDEYGMRLLRGDRAKAKEASQQTIKRDSSGARYV